MPGWCGEQDRQTDVQMCKTKQQAEAFEELSRSAMGTAKHPCLCTQVLVQAHDRAQPKPAQPSQHRHRLFLGVLTILS